MLEAAERAQVVAGWNDTATVVPEVLVPELIAARAAAVPDAVAVVCGGAVLSYGELDARAGRLAGWLAGAGAGPESVVGLCLERGAEMITAIVGVWRAGAAYLPLDPADPPARRAFLLADSQARVLVAGPGLDAGLDREQLVVLGGPVPQVPPVSVSAVRAGQAAYVIYTSGSTGQPKGVVVTHGGLANYLSWVPGRTGMGVAGARYAVMQTIVTDLVNTLIFTSLSTGGVLHAVGREVATDPRAAAGYLAANGIDYLKLVPSHLAALAGGVPLGELVPASFLMLGGEPVPAALVAGLASVAGQRLVVNHYGQTETTIGAVTARLAGADPAAGQVVAGRPVANTRVYVLDEWLCPVPAGVAGEVYMAGAQLARGYLGRAGLSAQRFVACPFGGRGELVYRTGDVGKWSGGGGSGRHRARRWQVKIRGYRIELGETEAVLAGCPGVGQAVVTVREDTPGQRRLAAYLIPVGDGQDLGVLAEAAREHAATRLPEYMLPSTITVLDAVPLTPNGKLDRAALPAPGPAAGIAGGRAPATLDEEILCGIFADVLGLERVGPQDDFFALGGHSLLAIRLVSRVRAVLGSELAVRALFEAPTPEGLAARLEPVVQVPPNRIPAGASAITPDMLPLVALDDRQIAAVVAGVDGGAANVADVYPLAPLQEGMFFHHLLAAEDGRNAYLLSTVLEFAGRDRLEGFCAALRAVIARHDIFRTSVAWQGLAQPVQVVWRQAELPVTEVSLTAGDGQGQAPGELLAAASEPMDLGRAPLLRVCAGAVPGGQGRWLGLVQAHHLVLDRTGIGVVLEEIRALLAGQANQLPAPVPFREYVARARLGVSREEHERYFADLLADVTEPTAPYGLMDVHGDDGGRPGLAGAVVSAELAGRVRAQARAGAVLKPR